MSKKYHNIYPKYSSNTATNKIWILLYKYCINRSKYPRDPVFHFSPFVINLRRVWLKLAHMPRWSRNLSDLFKEPELVLRNATRQNFTNAGGTCRKNHARGCIYKGKYAARPSKNDDRQSCGIGGNRWQIQPFQRQRWKFTPVAQTNGRPYRFG